MPDMQPPSQSEANAEALQRASDQLGEASEAVAAAKGEMEQAASEGGAQAREAQAASEALEAAEEALADASEALADAAADGGGDPEELQEAVAEAQEALAAAEEALAAAEAAAAEAAAEEEALADAASGGEEEPLPAAEEIPAGGGAESLAAAEESASGGGSSGGGAAGGGAAGGGASGDGAAGGGMPAGAEDPVSGAGGPAVVVVAVAGARGSLEQGQDAIAGALRALIIAGVFEPGSATDGLEGNDLPSGGVLVLMPGEPAESDKVAQLEGELEQTLVVIDGRLLEERDRLSNQRSGGVPDLPGPAGGDEEFGGDPGAEAAALLEEMGGGDSEVGGLEEGEQEVPTGEVASTGTDELGDGKRASNTQRPDNIPDNIPDGSDDDIVARQIREAAMNETDPVLREKLWREYINYKKGGG